MYKMIACDNAESAGNRFVGLVGDFRFNGVQFFFRDLYSSSVKSINNVDALMIVITRNTTYTFEKYVPKESE